MVLGSLGITKAIRSTRISSDAAVAVFLQLGLAGGIVLISVARGFGVSLESLLFGSVLLVDYQPNYNCVGYSRDNFGHNVSVL